MKRYVTPILLLAVCLLLTLPLAANAATTFSGVSGTANADTGVATVSGKVSAPSGTVILFVLQSGKTKQDLMEKPENMKSAVLYTASQKAQPDGSFEFVFDMCYSYGQSVQTGSYSFVLACGDVVEDESYVINFINTVDLKNALKAVNDAADSEAVEKALSDNREMLEIDSKLLDACIEGLTKEGKDEVYGALLKQDFESTAALNEKLTLNAPWRLLTDSKTASAMEANIKEFNDDYYKFDMDGKSSDFAKIELDKNKTIVYQAMVNSKKLNGAKECGETFLNASALGYLNDAVAPDAVQKLVSERSCFGVDMTAFGKLTSVQKSKVLADMIKEEIDEIDSVSTVWNALVKKYSDYKEPTKGGGGGGGSAGRKTNSVVVTNPTVEIQPVIGTGNTADTPQDAFSDLDGVEWAKESINALCKRGVLAGRENGKFEPDATVTRAEFVKMVTLAFGLESSGSEHSFGDVMQGAWYYGAVMAATENGIVFGNDEGMFSPNANITREDIAVILARTAEKKGVELAAGEPDFADSGDISEYAVNAVGAMRAGGVINGRENKIFAPKDNATRAEAAKMIYTLLTK